MSLQYRKTLLDEKEFSSVARKLGSAVRSYMMPRTKKSLVINSIDPVD